MYILETVMKDGDEAYYCIYVYKVFWNLQVSKSILYKKRCIKLEPSPCRFVKKRSILV